MTTRTKDELFDEFLVELQGSVDSWMEDQQGTIYAEMVSEEEVYADMAKALMAANSKWRPIEPMIKRHLGM